MMNTSELITRALAELKATPGEPEPATRRVALTFSEIIGQDQVRQVMLDKARVFKKSGRVSPHCLFTGPTGLGKTTMSLAFAQEIGTNLFYLMAPEVRDWSKVVEVLEKLREGDVLFIDEIHAMSSKWQERFYSLMEDFAYSDGETVVRIPKVTCIGATTHAGMLNDALRGRFGYVGEFVPYSQRELATIAVNYVAREYGAELRPQAAARLARIARGQARRAVNVCDSLVECADASTNGAVTSDVLNDSAVFHRMCKRNGVDIALGLDALTRQYLLVLEQVDEPVGLATISATINARPETVERMVEPFLLRPAEWSDLGENHCGPLARKTLRGREITPHGRAYLDFCRGMQGINQLNPAECLG